MSSRQGSYDIRSDVWSFGITLVSWPLFFFFCQLGILNCFLWIKVGCLWSCLIAKWTENNAWVLHLQFTFFLASSLFDFKGSPLGPWHTPNSTPLSYSSNWRFCLNLTTDWTFHWQIPVSEMEKRVRPTESSGKRRPPSLDERRRKSSILGWNAFFHKHVVAYREISLICLNFLRCIRFSYSQKSWD